MWELLQVLFFVFMEDVQVGPQFLIFLHVQKLRQKLEGQGRRTSIHTVIRALTGGFWPCHYWHVTSGLKPNVCCIKSSMSGLLSAIVAFMTWQAPLLKSTDWSVAARKAGNVALTCTAVGTCVGKWSCMLPSHQALGEPQGLSPGTLTKKKQWTTEPQGPLTQTEFQRNGP